MFICNHLLRASAVFLDVVWLGSSTGGAKLYDDDLARYKSYSTLCSGQVLPLPGMKKLYKPSSWKIFLKAVLVKK